MSKIVGVNIYVNDKINKLYREQILEFMRGMSDHEMYEKAKDYVQFAREYAYHYSGNNQIRVFRNEETIADFKAITMKKITGTILAMFFKENKIEEER